MSSSKSPAKVNWTSPSEWPLSVKIAIGTGATVCTGFALYYLLKKNGNSSSGQYATLDEAEFANKTAEEKSQILKNQGNKHFQGRNYAKATELFTKAINLMHEVPDSDEKNANLAILYNNYSACMEYQNDLNSALDYTTRAITLNPDYIKPYVRRSRIYKFKKDNKAAIYDLAKVFKVHAKTKENEKYLAEMFEVSAEILKQNTEQLYKIRIEREQFLPISQANLMEWMYQTCQHDPLLHRLNALGDEEPINTLDLALYYLKNHEFEKVIPSALNSLVDKFMDLRERFLARLLAARMYQYAGLPKQVQFIYDTLNQTWDNSTEQFKSNNIDLLMSLFAFKVSIEPPEVVEDQLKQNLELCTGNADPFIVLYMTYYNVANCEKSSEMLELAKAVEPTRPHIEFHEMSSKFLKASINQDLLSLHNLTAEMDRAVRENQDLPEFAVLTVARIFNTVQNTALGVEIMKKYAESHPNRSIIFEFLYAVLKRELDQDRVNATAGLVRDLEALQAKDPHNFEINRLLFRLYLTNDFEKAADTAEKSWLNTRGLDEFTTSYHDVIMSFALSGREIPMDDYLPPYQGPEYIHADLDENKHLFSDEVIVTQ